MKGKAFDSHKIIYTDEEINELADWLEALTIQQVFFIRASYEQMLLTNAHEAGSTYVQ